MGHKPSVEVAYYIAPSFRGDDEGHRPRDCRETLGTDLANVMKQHFVVCDGQGAEGRFTLGMLEGIIKVIDRQRHY